MVCLILGALTPAVFAQAPAEGWVDTRLTPQRVMLEVGEIKSVDLHLQGAIQCEPDRPGPRDLYGFWSRTRGVATQGSGEYWVLQPFSVKISWSPSAQGLWTIDEVVTFEVTAEVAASEQQAGEVLTRLTVNPESVMGTLETACSPWGYHWTGTSEELTLKVPAEVSGPLAEEVFLTPLQVIGALAFLVIALVVLALRRKR